MSTVPVPASAAEALEMLESAMEFLADADAADMPAEALADCLRGLERADAIEAAARGRFLEAFDAKDGHLADGRRNSRTWLVHCLRVTRGQAGEHKAIQALAREHQPLLAGLREQAVTTSVALQLARWTGSIPAEFREQAEEILVAVARAGADLRALAQICAEIRYRTAPPDPHDDNDKHLDRGLSLGTTFDGAGVIHGDLTPECAAMVQAVLDALVALRDQTCQFPGGCDQPAAGCEPHHVIHRRDGGRTSLANLKDYCWWHHHVVLHELGWTLTVRPDGTSQVQSPTGKIIAVTARRRAPGDRPRSCGRYNHEARMRSTAGRIRSRASARLTPDISRES